MRSAWLLVALIIVVAGCGDPGKSTPASQISGITRGPDINLTSASYPLESYELQIGQSYRHSGYAGKYPIELELKGSGIRGTRGWVDVAATFSNGDRFNFRLYEKQTSSYSGAPIGNRAHIALLGLQKKDGNITIAKIGISTSNPESIQLDQIKRAGAFANRGHGVTRWKTTMRDIPQSRKPPVGMLGDIADRELDTVSITVDLKSDSNLFLGLSVTIECYRGDSFKISNIGTVTVENYSIAPAPADISSIGGKRGDVEVALNWQY